MQPVSVSEAVPASCHPRRPLRTDREPCRPAESPLASARGAAHSGVPERLPPGARALTSPPGPEASLQPRDCRALAPPFMLRPERWASPPAPGPAPPAPAVCLQHPAARAGGERGGRPSGCAPLSFAALGHAPARAPAPRGHSDGLAGTAAPRTCSGGCSAGIREDPDLMCPRV